MLRTLSLAAAVALVATAPGAGAQASLPRRVDTTFAFAKNGWLDVSIVSGTVVITGTTKPEAHVFARIEDGGIEASYSDGRITLNVRGDRTSRSRRRLGEAQFEIQVPIGTRVMASAVSGDIRVRGTAAEVQANTVSGNLEVVDAADRIEAQTTSGDIRLDRIRGRLRVGTTSGDIELDDVTAPDLDLHSVSAGIRIRRLQATNVRIATTSGDVVYDGGVDPKGTYEISTHSGDVRFAVPPNTGADLAVHTYSGSIDSAFPITIQPGENIRPQRRQRMEFSVGGGGARVTITTFSGDITIERGPARSTREE
jgi:DUF4097 and DUF4098 domain-containing protein YvlB